MTMEIKEATSFIYANLNKPNIEFWAFEYQIFKDNKESKYVAISNIDNRATHSQVLNSLEECNLWLINN